MLLDKVRATRDRLLKAHKSAMFHRAMRCLLRDPRAVASSSSPVLAELVYGWDNDGWSGEPELLRSCIAQALAAKAPILECGSGLSTLVLGVAAQCTGNSVWALEHLPEWSERVQRCLDEFDIGTVRLCVAPLAHYDECDWYAPPLESMPGRFGLVVCDGPPSTTFGGRYGLVPVMKSRLQPGCVIMLDDATREAEQETVRRWSEELPCKYSRIGQVKPFFTAVVEEPASSPLREEYSNMDSR